MTRPVVAVAIGLSALGGCTNNVMTAPVAVQDATAGQDNREIVLPLAIIGAVGLWGIQ